MPCLYYTDMSLFTPLCTSLPLASVYTSAYMTLPLSLSMPSRDLRTVVVWVIWSAQIAPLPSSHGPTEAWGVGGFGGCKYG